MITSVPENSYLRLSQIVPGIVPIGRSTLWAWVKDGKFPKPVKLSDRVTVWRSNDLKIWLAQRDATVTVSRAMH